MTARSKHPVSFLWIENSQNARLRDAQLLLEQSCLKFGLQPLRYGAGRDLIPIGNVLERTRKQTAGPAFVWCNSDVVLTRNPFDVPDSKKVYGFYRKEVPTGEITQGVDMYYIPVKWWDDYLSKDIPKIYLGASYVDWWISRAMEKVDAYENLIGYIDHFTHPQSPAAGSDSNPYYQKNFRAYNSWAKRNGLSSIYAPPYLIPKVGHVWGVRDLFRRLREKSVRP